MNIDVVLLTKNSVEPCLRECVQSVKDNVPVKRFIVVDGGSTDDTIKVVKEIFPDAVIIDDSEGNRATARQISIDVVDTDWFMFIDSDVILHKNWFKEAFDCVNSKIGAVQGSAIQRVSSTQEDFDYVMRRLRKLLGGLTYRPFLEPVHRGYTGDIIIKTKLVKDIKIPTYLHFYEDHYIKRWIENKGFIWHRSEKARCDHFMGERSARMAYDAGFVSWIIGFASLKRSLIACATIFPKILLALCLRPNLKMALWQLQYQYWSMMGVMKAQFSGKKKSDINKLFQFTVGSRREEIDVSPDYIRVI